jgi:hypothetical protein
MRSDFNRFVLPIAVTNRKAAVNAIAAGVLMGSLLALLSGVAAAIVGLRHGDIKTTALCSATALVMALVTIGTWKRVWLAPLIGLFVGVAIIAWQLALGKIVAIVLIVPIVGAFWTAMRGIAFFSALEKPRSTGTAEPQAINPQSRWIILCTSGSLSLKRHRHSASCARVLHF